MFFWNPIGVLHKNKQLKHLLALKWAVSPAVRPEIELSGAASVTLRKIADRAKFDKSTSGDFRVGAYLPATRLRKNYKPGGLHYAYYEGQ